MKQFFTLTLSLLYFMAFSYGQTDQRLAIQGVVVDNEGVPLENAQVELLNTSFSTRTNNSGKFGFQQVPNGHYIIVAKKPGFATISKHFQLNSDTSEVRLIIEPETNRLEAVTVTAQKREEIAQEIPLSITSLSHDAVKESRIQNINDLTAISPNLYASDPGDRRTVTSIRGIVSTSYDPAIAVYIDGVNQFNLDTYYAAF
ncbi:carboxypeptidase regulatory-like domain-containing protein [Antarcticibacterium sp. 1MA-6-2]|uniref:carboxypeptidase regulatory-like domain-containing protein n=1 Tax=Antarcticibacterium sp. 1MA-6-2 TaxID=2908210 RepID=UPI001F2A98FD|nr:carboxypeptidase regulatory-like domain-containing protein [Antarcticibacterium sp. 1MA-6-2]UJH91852.1 carboxypeptidase regulatory-like domain-containing protein [Antarcticibacterium sp. 1MA-6-2]